MDFYYAMTNYHVLCCLLHKMCFNKNDGILYISTYMKYNQPEIVDRIKESKIFEEVYFYDEVEYKKTEKIMSDAKLEDEIKRICNSVEKTLGEVIKKSNNFFLCSDFYSIGLYLITKKIKYNYFEDGCGTISRQYLPFRLIEKDNPNRAKIVKKVNALGENEYTIARYVDLESQEDGYYNKKDKDFSVKKLLKNVSKENIKKILKIYNIRRKNIKNEENVLLLTMHYGEIIDRKEQIKIYSYLLDYFTLKNEQIIIKPHPADNIQNYENIFHNVTELNRYMPSELFPYCIDGKFKKGLTCWSTAIYGLKNIIDKIIDFNVELDKTYIDFDKYYSIVMFLKKNREKHIQSIKILNINSKQLFQLMEFHFSNYKKYYIIEECSSISDINDNDILITNILNKKTNNRVIEIDAQFKSDSALRIIKQYDDYKEYHFIGLYNFKTNAFSFGKEMYYSNYRYTVDIIKSDVYLDHYLFSNTENNKKIKAIENKYEQDIKKINCRIWELEQHIKYQDRIISHKVNEIESLKARGIKAIIKERIKKRLNIKEDNV